MHYPRYVYPLTDLADVTVKALCYCNSNAWGWDNSFESGVISIIDMLILEYGKKLDTHFVFTYYRYIVDVSVQSKMVQ